MFAEWKGILFEEVPVRPGWGTVLDLHVVRKGPKPTHVHKNLKKMFNKDYKPGDFRDDELAPRLKDLRRIQESDNE